MIPFPLMGGGMVKPDPIPEGADYYTGAAYKSKGDLWTWSRRYERWNQVGTTKPDPDHPTHYDFKDFQCKIGTDGSFRFFNGGTNDWADVPGVTGAPVPLTVTDDGINIGTSVFDVINVMVSSNLGYGYSRLLCTTVLGRPDLMDLYLIGERSPFTGSSIQNVNWTNAYPVAKNIKRGRVWATHWNVVVETSEGEMWAWGMNFNNQYGPWNSGVTASSPARQKFKPFGKILDFPVPPEKIKDIFPGVTMVLVADTDGKFWTKGENIGQISDTGGSVTVWTEVSAARFPGFKKFYPTANGQMPTTTDVNMSNCVWYWTDTGFRHFGNIYGIMDGSVPVIPASGPLPTVRLHSSPVGLPSSRTTDEPAMFSFTPDSVRFFPRFSIWYNNPEEMYVADPSSGLQWDFVEGSIFGRQFNRASAPVGKHRNPKIDFNREATLITGFDGKYYASGTSTVNNGLSPRTTVSTFVDQKMDSALIAGIELSDSPTGKTQFLRNDNLTFMVADLSGGSNFFGNGSFWKQTVKLAWPSYPSFKATGFKSAGVILVGAAAATPESTQTWRWRSDNYNTIVTDNQSSNNGLDVVTHAGEGHLALGKNGNNTMIGGVNVGGVFGAWRGWYDFVYSYKSATEAFVGTATASTNTLLAMDSLGQHWIIGKNYWNIAGGQPVIPYAGQAPVKWSSQPGFPALPNFRKWVPAMMGYKDDEGTVSQPFFMYRGSDGLFYAAGSNTTGALGSAPATRDEVRWTFQPITGSEIFVGKNVRVSYGHGNCSCLLFVTEGKVYGIGLPNTMKWNDEGTISDPFFPGFNRRLNEITFLADLPDVIWTRPK